MAAPTTSSLRRRAESVARHLAAVQAVDGVCLFGSIARGDVDGTSDIDILAVGSDPELTPTRLLKTLPDKLRQERISLVYRSREELEELFATGASFVDHLRHEGEILYDAEGLLRHVFEDDFLPSLNVDQELDAELRRLDVYSNLKIFKGNFLFVLAQLYAIGKSIVMLGLVSDGERQYNRDAAFAAFKRRNPGIADDVDRIARLRPFYRLVTRRGHEPLPFSYRGSEDEVRAALKSIRKLADAVR
jgi:predicted nucleotidyltransferase